MLAGADTLIRGMPDGYFNKLSDSLKLKFQKAGGDDRHLPEAESFYRDSIPYSVRISGPGALAPLGDRTAVCPPHAWEGVPNTGVGEKDGRKKSYLMPRSA